MKNKSLVLYSLQDSEPEGTGSQGQTTQPSGPQQNDSKRPTSHSSGIHASIGDNNEDCGNIENCGDITATGDISPELLKILLKHAPELSTKGGEGNKKSSKIIGARRVDIRVGRNVGGGIFNYPPQSYPPT